MDETMEQRKKNVSENGRARSFILKYPRVGVCVSLTLRTEVYFAMLKGAYIDVLSLWTS